MVCELPEEGECTKNTIKEKDRALRVIITRIILRKGIQGVSDVETAPSYDPSQNVSDCLAKSWIEFRKNHELLPPSA